jgi:hypothetical protein
MVRTVLKYVVLGMVLLLVVGWLWGGGWRGIVSFVRTIPNPIDILWGTSTSTYEVRLPWAIDVPHGPDIELYLREGAGYSAASPEEQIVELESAYKALQGEVARQSRPTLVRSRSIVPAQPNPTRTMSTSYLKRAGAFRSKDGRSQAC